MNNRTPENHLSDTKAIENGNSLKDDRFFPHGSHIA
jgi:hypothetical protein